MPGMGKRRTVLQIEGPSVSSRRGYGQNSSANALRGLMANYGDSDEEQEVTPPRYVEFRQTETKEPAKPKTEMDAKLADFMAEIDAMDTASNSPGFDGDEKKQQEDEPIDGKPISSGDVSTEAGMQGEGDGAVAGTDYAQSSQLTAVGEWQELLDENTNCVYYWNMYTNEVTWEMPEAFKLLQQQQQQQTESTELKISQTDSTTVDATQMEQPPTLKAAESYAADAQGTDMDDTRITNGNIDGEPLTEPPKLEPEIHVDTSELEKLPVYGSARVDYKVDVPDELAEIVKDDLKSADSEDDDGKVDVKDKDTREGISSQKSKSQPNYLAGFSRGATLPGSADSKDGRNEEIDDRGKEREEEEEESDEEDDGRYDLYHEPVKVAKETKKEEEEKDELYAVDMFADEMDDIDTQLELALEKKKAELKELEEAEVKKSPEPAKTEKGKKRKSEVPDLTSIYDESGEVDLSKFKKKRLENLAGKQKMSGSKEAGIQCNLEDEQGQEEKDKVKQKQKAKEEAESKEAIADMVSTMTNKLEFLGISNKGLNKFQVLLIEMETRIQDWREGLLDTKHLLQRLEASDWELQRYEIDAAPSGWLCSWDRYEKTPCDFRPHPQSLPAG